VLPPKTTRTAKGILSYSATTNRYTYAWKTNEEWEHNCRQFVLTLKDGTKHTAYLKFGEVAD